MQACIKPHNGAPTLFLDNRPVFGGHQWLSNHPGPNGFPGADAVRLFGQAGVHINALAVAAASDWCGHWCGPRPGMAGDYDFTMVEPQLRAILKEDRDALFHMRIYFETAEWWN